MAVTIKDIAREAGVSFSTVSSVLRSANWAGGRASARTRARIVEVAQRLNYHPNNIGRGLRTGRSRLIAFLCQNFEAALIMETMIGVENVCHRNDINTVLGTFDSPESCRNLLDSLWRKRVDGVLIPATSEVAYCEIFAEFAAKIPMVNLFGRTVPNCPGILVEGAEIGRLGAEYLLGLGHRSFLIAGARPDCGAAFRECCRKSGIPEEQILSWPSIVKLADGRHAMRQLVALGLPVSAIFAYNDENAAGFLQEAAAQGIQVPQELSVLGVNDSKICDMTYPPLTTIAQPQRERGEQAAETLLAMIAGQSFPSQITLQPYLVARSSCAAPGRLK